MKKIVAFMSCIMALLFVACGSENGQASSKAASSQVDSVASSEVQSSSISPEDQELLKKIAVTYRADTLTDENGKQRMLIDVENKSDKVFNGDISVTFVEDQEILGSDVFSAKNFKPGRKETADLYIVPTKSRTFVFDISDFTFTGDSADGSESLDKEKSKALTECMYESFGGNGNKELATSWYPYIKKIEVYKNESGFYAVATATTSDSEIVNHIGNAIFANYVAAKGNDMNLNSTIVQDESGKELFRRSK